MLADSTQRPTVAQSAALAAIISFFILPTFSEPSPIEFLSRSTFAPPRSVPRLTRFRTRSHEALGKTTCTHKSTILPNDTAIIPQSGFALQGGQVSPVWGKSMPNRQKPLILLGHFDFSPAKRPPQKNFFSPIFTPAAARRARPHAPPRALPRLFVRVVLALRATTKRGTSDAPGELASISVAAAFRVSRRRAFVSGARGGDKSRDALRRTGRDAVSSPRATPRIKVAQQPASTRPAFVVARSAPIATRAGGEQIYRSQAPPYLAAGT